MFLINSMILCVLFLQHRRDLDNAHGQIRALKQELDQLRSNVGINIPADVDSAEIINALKAQIQICTEDFESERRDRERVQAKRMCLEAEVEQLKKEVHILHHRIFKNP